jgi:hypothetical protein
MTSDPTLMTSTEKAWYLVLSVVGIGLIVAGIICLHIHGQQLSLDNEANSAVQSAQQWAQQYGITPTPSPLSMPNAFLLPVGMIGVIAGPILLGLVGIFAFAKRFL